MDKNNNEEQSHTVSNTMRVLVGLVMGGLVGAGVMMLLAPQSGKRTRALIQRKGIELREQAADGLDEAVAQVRGKARQVSHTFSDKADELQQRGQDLIDEQKDNLSALRSSTKKALQSARG
jgi:gas vesicle protein